MAGIGLVMQLLLASNDEVMLFSDLSLGFIHFRFILFGTRACDRQLPATSDREQAKA